jgi:hypothetical protein
MKKLLHFIFLMFFIINQMPFAIACEIKSRPILVEYVNGINTTESEARQINLKKIIETSPKTYQNNPIIYELSYNQSGGLISNVNDSLAPIDDVGQSLIQKLTEHPDYDPSLTNAQNIALYRAALYCDFRKSNNSNEKPLTPELEKFFKEECAKPVIEAYTENLRLLTDQTYVIPETFVIANKMRADLAKLKTQYGVEPYLLLLGHSQGTLFTNQIHQLFTQTYRKPIDEVAVYQIAAAASYVAGRGGAANNGYTTSSSDSVVTAIRISQVATLGFGSFPLPWNIDSSSGHNLVEYLTTQNTLAKIQDDLQNTFTLFRDNNVKLKVTLSWTNPNVDFDLGVLEPIYKGSKWRNVNDYYNFSLFGNYGNLSPDATGGLDIGRLQQSKYWSKRPMSFGVFQETYQTCDKTPLGDFYFQVHYTTDSLYTYPFERRNPPGSYDNLTLEERNAKEEYDYYLHQKADYKIRFETLDGNFVVHNEEDDFTLPYGNQTIMQDGTKFDLNPHIKAYRINLHKHEPTNRIIFTKQRFESTDKVPIFEVITPYPISFLPLTP